MGYRKRPAYEKTEDRILEKLTGLIRKIEEFVPFNEQEEKDKTELLRYLSRKRCINTR